MQDLINDYSVTILAQKNNHKHYLFSKQATTSSQI